MKRKLGKESADIIYSCFMKKNFKTGNKTLITTTDGIGDFIVREKIFTKLLSKIGKENIVVLAKDKLVPILKKMGVENIVIYTDEKRKKFSGRVKLFRELNEIGLKQIVSLEFDQHDTFVKHFSQVKKIGFNNVCHSEMDKYYDQLIPYSKGSIINDVVSFYKNYFKEEVTFEQCRPDIKNLFNFSSEYKNSISIGVGSIDRKKMIAPEIFSEMLKGLKEKFPEKRLVLLGKGDLEKKFIDELKNLMSLEGIENQVNNISLDKTMEIINSSDLYLGLDSGLYNFSFALGKKIVGIFTEENRFSHQSFKGVALVTGKGQGKENYFGNPKINSINPEEIISEAKGVLKG